MPCPFLARLSPNYIRNYGSSVVMNFPQHCPVMSRMINTASENAQVPESIVNKCPFLSNEPKVVKEANPAMEEDIINIASPPAEENNFQYERFFHEQIMKKKKDHSYR